MRKLFLILMTMAACAWGLQAQTRTISGTVLDAADNEPLVGATIAPIGGGQGAAADIDGKFTIKVPANVTKAKVSYVGYETQTVDLKDGMVVHLASTADALDEVMVVAYGTAKKSEYTGSASVVDASTIEDRLVTNVANALNGTVAGVQTLSSNGQPGESPSIRIRGVGSINASTSPLWVVDGVPFEGDIAALNPADIESMTVLKDAAAAALYGARGANGVILVTTKRGKRGDARVTVDLKWGANSRATPYYDVIESTDEYMGIVYKSLYNGAIYGMGYTPDAAHDYANKQAFGSSGIGYQIYTVPDGEQVFMPGGAINPNATLGWSDGVNYFIPDDWKKYTLRNGMRQEYNVNVSGATEKLNYYISAGYVNDEGLINNSSYDRLSVRTSVDYQVKPWLKIGSNVTYTHSEQNYPGDQTNSSSTGNAFMMAYSIAPVYPMFLRDAEGNIMYNETYGHPIYDYGQEMTSQKRTFNPGANPVGSLLYDKVESLTDIINGKWMVELKPVDGLTITGNASLNI